VFIFAIVFGLSMDYEVFLLSRIREEYDRTGNNATAVADGLDDAARDDALVKLRASLAGHTGDDGTVAYDAAMWIITARKP
jgi:uncharacterized membrane protein YdfJ with MMPL/SSD domain